MGDGMGKPELGASGKLFAPALIEFDRFIDQDENCIICLAIENAETGAEPRKIQFSMTSRQCRDLGEQLLIGAQVIEHVQSSKP
jgi:hypothetical protein